MNINEILKEFPERGLVLFPGHSPGYGFGITVAVVALYYKYFHENTQ